MHSFYVNLKCSSLHFFAISFIGKLSKKVMMVLCKHQLMISFIKLKGKGLLKLRIVVV